MQALIITVLIMWSKIRQIKGLRSIMCNYIHGNYDNNDIDNVFPDKYMSLYNSVPYSEDEMSKIKLIIDMKVSTCNPV